MNSRSDCIITDNYTIKTAAVDRRADRDIEYFITLGVRIVDGRHRKCNALVRIVKDDLNRIGHNITARSRDIGVGHRYGHSFARGYRIVDTDRVTRALTFVHITGAAECNSRNIGLGSRFQYYRSGRILKRCRTASRICII